VLVAIHKAIDAFLMQVESLVFVRQLVNVVDVNEPVKRTADHVVQVRVKLNLRDPSFVRVF
jgi:hypothetical protein